MIEERHRLGYGLFIIILVWFAGYFFDLSWQWSQIQALQEELKKEQAVLLGMSTDLKKKEAMKVNMLGENLENQSDLNIHPQRIDELMESLKISGLKLRTMTALSRQIVFGQQIDHVRLTATGTFAGVNELMMILKKSIPEAFLSDFSFEVKSSHEALFSMDYRLWQHRPFSLQKASIVRMEKSEHDPLCFSPHELIRDQAENNIHLVTLSQIEMLAIVFEEGQEKALLQLPGGDLLKMMPGMVLGYEQGKIMRIDKEGMDVMLQNKEKIRIWRKGVQQ